jgi:hypothetical protein
MEPVWCASWNIGRLAMPSGVRTAGVCGGHGRSLCPLLQEAVVRSASAGRVAPLLVGRGELALQPVAGGEAAVGVAGAGVGGAGAVAGHHRPRSPPGQAHQIHFGAALGKPLVGEGVAELVGV